MDLIVKTQVIDPKRQDTLIPKPGHLRQLED